MPYFERDVRVHFFGITCDRVTRPPRRWQRDRVGSRRFAFFPLMYLPKQGRKRIIPVSLRAAAAWSCFAPLIKSGIILYNRNETLVIPPGKGVKQLLVVNNDVNEQVSGKVSEVLWSRFPSACPTLQVLEWVD